MPSSVLSGSILAVPGTASIIGTFTTAGVYVFSVDLGNLTFGDEVETRIADLLTPGGTISLAYIASYGQSQTTQVKVSPPIPVMTQTQFSIKMISGGARTFNFEIFSV